MNRYVTLVAACAIQVCLGAVYGWSTFVGPLRDAHGLTTADTQAVFGVTVAIFTVAMVGAGRILPRVGPRRLAMAGGLLYGGGYLLAALSGGNSLLLILTLGVMGGAGIGLAYVCPLAVCPRLFPEHKGLVTGLSVAGFGLGAVVVAQVVSPWLERGAPVLSVFWTLGIVYGFIVIGSAWFLGPPWDETGPTSVCSPSRCTGLTPLVVGMFAGTFAGLMVIGNLVPLGIAGGIDATTAALAVTSLAVGNAVGRVAWGRIYDRIGAVTIPASLVVTIVGLVLLKPSTVWDPLFIGSAALMGFAFGANFVLYASRIATVHGSLAVGTLYPLVFLAYGVSALAGPPFGGWIYDLRLSYGLPIGVAVVVAAVGAAVTGRALWRHDAVSTKQSDRYVLGAQEEG